MAESVSPIDISKLIGNALSNSRRGRISIFELFEEEFLYQADHPFEGLKFASTADAKKATLTKRESDAWENFCLLYLTARYPREYTKIWLWKEVPTKVKKVLKLHRNEDNGIDIIAETRRGYVAIQCKFRRQGNIKYDDLATFYTTCISGQYYQKLVMTNTPQITGKLAEVPGNTFIVRQDFINTQRAIWHRMTKGVGEALDEEEIDEKPTTREELRERHLAFFESKLNQQQQPKIAVTPEHYRELVDFCRAAHCPIDPKFYSEVHFNEILLRLRKMELETLPKQGTQKELRKRLNEKAIDLKEVVLGLQGDYAFEGSLTATILLYLQEKELL